MNINQKLKLLGHYYYFGKTSKIKGKIFNLLLEKKNKYIYILIESDLALMMNWY